MNKHATATIVIFFIVFGTITTNLSDHVKFTVQSNFLLPIRLSFTSSGVYYEIAREWTTPFVSFGFETELPVEKFRPEQLIVVVHNNAWPEHVQYQAFGIDYQACVPPPQNQALPEGICQFDGNMEVVLDKRHQIGRIMISPEDITLYDDQHPVIRYDNRVIWIDISGRRIQKMSLLPSDQSWWESIWDGPYKPGQFTKAAFSKPAPTIIWYGAVDLFLTVLDIFPQSVAYLTNSYEVGKVARFVFNGVVLYVFGKRIWGNMQNSKDADMTRIAIFFAWIACIMATQFSLYGF